MLSATEEIALLRARHLQALLPDLIKGSIWVHVDFDAIIVTITTREVGAYRTGFEFDVNLTAFDMAKLIVNDYKRFIKQRFFK